METMHVLLCLIAYYRVPQLKALLELDQRLNKYVDRSSVYFLHIDILLVMVDKKIKCMEKIKCIDKA